MCEKCEARRERNTVTKRAAMELLFALPSHHLYPRAELTPGYLTFLSLCRQMEQLSRAPAINGEMDPEEAALFRRMVLDLTPEDRTAVVRIAEYVLDMATGIRMNVGTAKVAMKDADEVSVAWGFKDGAIVLLVNGEEVQRIEFAPGTDEETMADAAERAMQEHRAQHPESF